MSRNFQEPEMPSTSGPEPAAPGATAASGRTADPVGSTRIARTAGEYRLSGDTADMVTLMRNGTEIAAVIRCG